MRPKPRIHKSHLPCFGASWWLIGSFAGSFIRTKIHMETQKIVGFQKKTPLPWGSMLNFKVLWFRSRATISYMINRPSQLLRRSWHLKNRLCYKMKKKWRGQQQSQWVKKWILTQILQYNVFSFSIFTPTWPPPPSLPNVADLWQANGTPSWSSSRVLRKEAPLPEIQRNFRWEVVFHFLLP